jgi:hypothetical protein
VCFAAVRAGTVSGLVVDRRNSVSPPCGRGACYQAELVCYRELSSLAPARGLSTLAALFNADLLIRLHRAVRARAENVGRQSPFPDRDRMGARSGLPRSHQGGLAHVFTSERRRTRPTTVFKQRNRTRRMVRQWSVAVWPDALNRRPACRAHWQLPTLWLAMARLLGSV